MAIELTARLPTIDAPFVRRFGLMGEVLRFRTNDERLMAAAEASFGRFPVPDAGEPLDVTLVVDHAAPADSGVPPRLTNQLTGRYYTIVLDGFSHAVADPAAGHATGRVSPAVAGDATLVRVAFVESMSLCLLALARGYATVHAAVVARDGLGFVLQGPAGTGKSTLAMAALRRGFQVVAEDVVFVRRRPDGELELWGMPWVLHLLPDTVRWFPELNGRPIVRQPNGEDKIVVDVDGVRAGAATPVARAGGVILLDRGMPGEIRVDAIRSDDPAVAFEVHWPWEGGWSDGHAASIQGLLDRGLARLHLDGPPDEAARALEGWIDRQAGN